MRNLILIILLILVGSAAFLSYRSNHIPAQEPVKSVVEGEVAPDFKLEDTKGNIVSLSDLRGKVVMVNFWATWCPPCKEEMPSMEELNKALAGDDFVMLAINTENNGRTVVPEFLEKTPYNFPILYDDEGVVQKRYGVYKFPESFIVNKEGIVVQKIIGPLHWSGIKTISYFKKLIKG